MIALAAVIALALIARLVDIQNVEFFHDEAMVAMMAQEMADGLTFPLQGILSSVGIPNPPTSIYVMAVPYVFTNNPVVVTAFIALLNAAGVGVLWAIARRWIGYVPALAAGIWLAVTPWAVLYSRKIWAQDYMLPFLLVALAAALWGWKGGRRWGQLAMLPVMLFGMQIHFAGWALVPLFRMDRMARAQSNASAPVRSEHRARRRGNAAVYPRTHTDLARRPDTDRGCRFTQRRGSGWVGRKPRLHQPPDDRRRD
ncbi:MAG: hypothetical protein HND48_13530 [Chloroflexi bacterium]|nr:hypothetical protein [Chloroflexota bacterium]